MLLIAGLIACVALLPAQWMGTMRTLEQDWLYRLQGPSAAGAVLDKAARWKQYLLGATDNHSASSLAVGNQAASSWIEGRLLVLSQLAEQILERFALFYAWWPYLFGVLVMSVAEGILRRKIRSHAFVYDSPLTNQAVTHGLIALTIFTIAAFLAPVPFLAILLPLGGLVYGRLIGAAVTQIQHRQ